jgi:hypothetical protein
MERYSCTQCGTEQEEPNPQQADGQVDLNDAHFCDMCVTCFIKQNFVKKCGFCHVYRFENAKCDCCQKYCCNPCNQLKICLFCCEKMCPWCFVCKCEINYQY